MNVRLQPKLRAPQPGTRIVSHDYDMGGRWKPHFWTVPKR